MRCCAGHICFLLARPREKKVDPRGPASGLVGPSCCDSEAEWAHVHRIPTSGGRRLRICGAVGAHERGCRMDGARISTRSPPGVARSDALQAVGPYPLSSSTPANNSSSPPLPPSTQEQLGTPALRGLAASLAPSSPEHTRRRGPSQEQAPRHAAGGSKTATSTTPPCRTRRPPRARKVRALRAYV